MLKTFITKLGLGTAFLAGCILLPAAASAQTANAHLQAVDHHGWGGGHWDRGRSWGGWHGGGWHGYSYPAYGGGLGLGFYFGSTPSYNYYGAPAYPAVPAYPPAGAYTAPNYPPPTTYGTPGYPPANSYPAPSYPPSY